MAPATDSRFNTGCAASCTVTMCSCTQFTTYWSSNTDQGTPSYAWIVDFDNGYVLADDKSTTGYARAVRNAL